MRNLARILDVSSIDFLTLCLDLNLYQVACKPRLFEGDKEEAEEDDNEEIDLSEMAAKAIQQRMKATKVDQEEMVGVKLFDKLKETLLCQVCSDVFQDPLNVK